MICWCAPFLCPQRRPVDILQVENFLTMNLFVIDGMITKVDELEPVGCAILSPWNYRKWLDREGPGFVTSGMLYIVMTVKFCILNAAVFAFKYKISMFPLSILN